MHQVILTWNPDSNFNYNVYRSTQSGGPATAPYQKINGALLAFNSGGTPSFVDSGSLTPGTDYFYVVTAVDSTGLESSFSNEAKVTTVAAPPAPTGLTGSAS